MPTKKSTKTARKKPRKVGAPRMRRQKSPPSARPPVVDGPIDIGSLDTDDDPVPE